MCCEQERCVVSTLWTTKLWVSEASVFAIDGQEDEPGYFLGVGGGGYLSRGSILRDYRGSRGIEQSSNLPRGVPLQPQRWRGRKTQRHHDGACADPFD